MGGPTVWLWLKERLSADQIEEIDVWLRSLSSNVKRDLNQRQFKNWPDNPNWDFHVCEAAFLGQPCIDMERSPVAIEITEFGFEAGGTTPYVERFDAIRDALGFLPQQSIQFDAFCNRKNDHRVLGLLVSHLAEKFDALVEIGEVGDMDMYPSLASSLPFEGITVVGWIDEDGRPSSNCIFDAPDFKAWLEHPTFGLLK